MGVYRNSKGLTLVEVAVASLILLLIVLGVFRADLSARYQMRSSRIELEVLNILQSYLEQERSQSYVNINDAAFAGVVFSDRGTADAADDITGSVTIDVTDNGDDTKTLLATAAWNQRQADQTVARNLSLQTLVAEP